MTDIVSWGRASSIYQPTSVEIEAHLAEVFTQEELAELDGDVSDLTKLPKTITEYIDEDRGI